jgi:hypothetical protein
MWEERQSLLPSQKRKKLSASKGTKKSNITLAIEEEVVNKIKDTAESEGLSINSKINSVLWKYLSFYKYVEQDGSLIIPSRSVNFFIENIDEEKWVQEYCHTLDEIIPFFFLELKIVQRLEDILKFVFDRLLVYGGSYKGYSCHVDNDGCLNLVFRHEYGIKWSRILSKVYTQFIEKTLNRSASCLSVTEKWFAIKISQDLISK